MANCVLPLWTHRLFSITTPRMSQHIRIATRASDLALAQANMVKAALEAAHSDIRCELLPMVTSGDRNQTDDLAHWGYKGLFTKEIEEALLSHTADIAVHSMKDMPSQLPDGLMIAAMLPRADARDAFISTAYSSLDALPQGAVVGSSSVRRSAWLRSLRPDLVIVPYRGNVPSRLRKLAEGEVAATLLAVAGLERLGLQSHITHILEPDVMLPAVAQGAIGIECRSDDSAVQQQLAAISHSPTMQCVSAERGVLIALDGSCKTPLSAYATLQNGQIHLRAALINPDNLQRWESDITGAADDAESIGRMLGNQLQSRAADDGFSL